MARRALIFDLDDTLYPERRFALSGFAAVASHVERVDGVPAATSMRVLVTALARRHRASAFQRLAEAAGLGTPRIDEWIEVYRTHTPRLRLARAVRRLLVDLRQHWPLAVVTNGLKDVQQRKVAALGLDRLIDTIVFAGLPGEGGKPAPEPFHAACEALGVEPACAVHVGDDLIYDVRGARGAGLRTIQLRRRGRHVTSSDADAVIERLSDVPAVAERLIQDA